jgi:hypothetical protein
MYGNGYGGYDDWSQPQVVNYAVQQPALPTRRVDTPAAKPCCGPQSLRLYGAVLATLAVTTLGLGIADVAITKQAYCGAGSACPNTGEPYVWVWVATGIWASVPIVLTGLFAMCVSSNPGKWVRLFGLFSFISTFIFTPALLILSSIEVWRGWSSSTIFYSFTGGTLSPGTLTPSPNPYQAKFAIPVAIAVLGGVMFLLTSFMTLLLCCCAYTLGLVVPAEPEPAPAPVVNQSFYYPTPRPQIVTQNAYAINYQPYSPPPLRYSGVNAYGSGGVLYGNFPARQGPSSLFSDFFKPESDAFWK